MFLNNRLEVKPVTVQAHLFSSKKMKFQLFKKRFISSSSIAIFISDGLAIKKTFGAVDQKPLCRLETGQMHYIFRIAISIWMRGNAGHRKLDLFHECLVSSAPLCPLFKEDPSCYCFSTQVA